MGKDVANTRLPCNIRSPRVDRVKMIPSSRWTATRLTEVEERCYSVLPTEDRTRGKGHTADKKVATLKGVAREVGDIREIVDLKTLHRCVAVVKLQKSNVDFRIRINVDCSDATPRHSYSGTNYELSFGVSEEWLRHVSACDDETAPRRGDEGARSDALTVTGRL